MRKYPGQLPELLAADLAAQKTSGSLTASRTAAWEVMHGQEYRRR